MKNVTISMDDKLHRKVRVDAARAGKSMSKYIAETLEKLDATGRSDESGARPNAQLEALRRLWDTPMWDVTENGRMPSAEERNARR